MEHKYIIQQNNQSAKDLSTSTLVLRDKSFNGGRFDQDDVQLKPLLWYYFYGKSVEISS